MQNTDLQMEQLMAICQKRLSGPRYEHSLKVMAFMEHLAIIYNFRSIRLARIVGLLHDIAKELPLITLVDYIKTGKIEPVPPRFYHPMYLHAPVGAYLIEHDLKINEPEVIDAVKRHSNLYPFDQNSFLTQLLFLADLMGSVKDWQGRKKLDEMAFHKQFHEAQLLVYTWVIEYFNKIGLPIHPNFFVGHNYYMSIVKPADLTFFDRE